ncbi:3-deoxy-7-phosphoheptulonate synthase, partial [Acetonema longum DSM 6540]
RVKDSSRAACHGQTEQEEQEEKMMVIVLHPSATQEQIAELKAEVEAAGCSLWPIQGKFILVFGVVGDTGHLDKGQLLNKIYVDKVLSVQEPYKKANRMF